MLGENSHSLYIVYHSILFLISIHTITHHSNQQSLHLSCLCLLFHITLMISHGLFLYFFHIAHGILLSFHIPSYHLSNLLQPLSIFLILLHIKYIQITHASLFLLVHTGIFHNHTPCHPVTPSHWETSSSHHQSHSCPHIPICKTFISWTFFHLYILFFPFCIIKSIFPYLFANLPYSTTDVLHPEFPIHSTR